MGNRSSRPNRGRTPVARNELVKTKESVKTQTKAPKPCKKKTMFVYSTCDWDEKHIIWMESQKLIGKREEPLRSLEEIDGNHECGICFNTFKSVLNQLACCKYEICTECYLQLKTPPKHLAKAGFVQPENPKLCPYCRTVDFEAIYPLGNAKSNICTTRPAENLEAPACKMQTKPAHTNPASTRRPNTTEFVPHADVPDSLDEIEQIMLMTALANSSFEHQEHYAATNSDGSAAATSSAYVSATNLNTSNTVDESLTFDLTPRSPPMPPLSSRRSRANTPELSSESQKRGDSNEDMELLPTPLTI